MLGACASLRVATREKEPYAGWRTQATLRKRREPRAPEGPDPKDAEIESLKAALKEREDAARREAERLRREKEELEDKTLKLRTTLAQQEREARMACEERDAAKRLLAEKQRAALSPEPSALSLNPEDSELEGGATVGSSSSTVYEKMSWSMAIEVRRAKFWREPVRKACVKKKPESQKVGGDLTSSIHFWKNCSRRIRSTSARFMRCGGTKKRQT